MGFSSFSIKKSAAQPVTSAALASPATVTNGVYEVAIDHAKGAITSVKNIASGVEVCPTIRLEFSGPLSTKRLAFSIQAL